LVTPVFACASGHLEALAKWMSAGSVPDGFLAELPTLRSFHDGDAFAHQLVAILLPGGLPPSA
jgi:hypothetical protein